MIDTATNAVIATIPVGEQPYCVAITPNGKHAYVTNVVSNAVSVIDTATNALVDTVAVGAPVVVAITPSGEYLFVSTNANSVSVIKTATNEVVGSPIPVGTYSWGTAITPDGKRVCVANLLSNDVSMIDAATHTVVATVPVGNGPSGVGIGWPL